MADKIVSTYEFETKQAVKNVNDLASQMNFLIKGLGEVEKASNKTKTATEKLRTSGFNPLNASINQFTRELPNAAISLQIFITSLSNQFGALQDSIQGLIAKNKELAAQGQKTQSVFRAISGAIFSWGTLLQVGVTLLVLYGKEIGNLISSLFKGTGAFDEAKKRFQTLNAAFESSAIVKAIQNINELTKNIDLAKRGFVSKQDVIDQYNKSIGQTTGQVTSLDEAEKSLIRNGEAYIKMTLLKTAANIANEEAANAAVEAAKEQLREEQNAANRARTQITINDPEARGLDQFLEQARETSKRKREADTKKRLDDLRAIANTFQQQAAEIARQYNFDLFGDIGQDQADRDRRLRELREALQREAKLAQDIADQQIPGGLQTGADREDAAFRERNARRLKLLEERIELEYKLIQQAEKDRVQLAEDAFKELEKLAIRDAEAEDQRNKERIRKQKELRQLEFDLASEFSNQLFDLRGNLASASADEELKLIEENKEKELEAVGNNRKKQAQIESEYDRKRAEILNRNAQTQRTLQLSEISVNTALAVAKAIAESPTTFGLPFSAFALAQGAIQYAFASSQPLPKYAKGTERVTGGIKGQDSVMALLMPDEAVIKATENVRHPGLAKAWNHGNLDQFLAMNYLAPALDELSRKAQVSVSNNYSNSTNNSFSDRKIVKSMQENTMVNRLILRQMKISNNDWKIPRKNNDLWN